MDEQQTFMAMATRLATENVRSGKGGPFAAVVVRNGEVIASGVNLVTATNDPTAHAEISAIREACKALNSHQLEGCEIYTSCEPCPMCLGAIYWARSSAVYYAASAEDAAAAGFDDSFIYRELQQPPERRILKMRQIDAADALTSFEEWVKREARIRY